MRNPTLPGQTTHTPYSIRGHDFVRSVVKKAASGARSDADLTSTNLQSQSHRRGYAVVVDDRTLQLVDAVEALNVVDKLLAVDTAPLTIGANGINHPEWIRLTLEVLLSRLRSIKDCLLLLVAEVFELRLPRREVNLRNLVPLVSHQQVIELLVQATDAIRSPDGDRAAIVEEQWREEGHEGTSGLDGLHVDLVSTVRASYRSRGDALIDLSHRLLDLSLPEFEQRWSAKPDRPAARRNQHMLRAAPMAASFGHT